MDKRIQKMILEITSGHKVVYTCINTSEYTNVFRYRWYSHKDIRREEFNAEKGCFVYERIIYSALVWDRCFPHNQSEKFIDEETANRYTALEMIR